MCIVSSAKIVQAKLTTKSMTKFLINNTHAQPISQRAKEINKMALFSLASCQLAQSPSLRFSVLQLSCSHLIIVSVHVLQDAVL